jgi:hypothetical protein
LKEHLLLLLSFGIYITSKKISRDFFEKKISAISQIFDFSLDGKFLSYDAIEAMQAKYTSNATTPPVFSSDDFAGVVERLQPGWTAADAWKVLESVEQKPYPGTERSKTEGLVMRQGGSIAKGRTEYLSKGEGLVG